MAAGRFMEIGNLVCRFGDEQVLLDNYSSVVEPAFFSEYERTYGDTRYLFMQTQLIDVGTLDAPSPAIAGRFVKDTVLHQQQRLVDGKLLPAEGTLESAPSSLFVFILRGHRLLYLREHRGSPDMSQYATTVERFLRRARQEHINRIYLKSKQSAERVTKKSLADALPRPDVSVNPILADESIDEFLDRFSVLTSVRISLAPVNEEPDLNEFFKQFREQQGSVGAGKAMLEYRGTKTDGLNIGPVSNQLKAATDGHAEFQVEGIDRNDRPLKGDNEEFKVKVPLEIDNPAVGDAAKRMGAAFRALVDSDAVRPGNVEERHEATLLGIVGRLGQ